MANRVLRDWTDSETIHSLSCEAERFFTRLIMKVDDYGRYHSNIHLLRAALFPLHESLSPETIKAWLDECIKAGLLFLYSANGKNYLEIKMFNQTLKVRKSKFPPSSEEDRLKLQQGYVYVIGIDYKRPVKIGFSINPWSRLKEIAPNHHEKLEILLTFKAEKRLESLIHLSLKDVRTKNEWFQLSAIQVQTLIDYSNQLFDNQNLLELLRSNASFERSRPETETETETKPNLEIETETETAHPSTIFPVEEKVSKKKKFVPPTLHEAITFFESNGYNRNTAERAWSGYNAAEWHDSRGKPIKNWKQKFIHVWFKDENKIHGSATFTNGKQKPVTAKDATNHDLASAVAKRHGITGNPAQDGN